MGWERIEMLYSTLVRLRVSYGVGEDRKVVHVISETEGLLWGGIG